MFEIKSVQKQPVYGLAHEEKHVFLTDCLRELTQYHYDHCQEYQRILDSWPYDLESIESYQDIPFLPVRLFKEYTLKSVGDEYIIKKMTSSGTTGQQVSKIFLDNETANNQRRILSKIVSERIGKKRLPMIIIDSRAVLKDRNMFSARGAGILGFSIFSKDSIYALDEQMKLDIDGLSEFLEKHSGEDILLFGFTFMIWQHFVNELQDHQIKIDLSRGRLIHGGGWKKLDNLHISNDQFKKTLYDFTGLKHVHNYYGMVEQTGSIYMECEEGHLHAPVFSDVIVRRPKDFSIADFGEEGLIEVCSILPKSYPGHVLLTEDSGVVLGEDDCPCGRKGKYFKVIGRIKNAEIRGCSDTYASSFR